MYYDRKEGTMQTNAPPLLAISMVMVVHMSNTDGIAQCSISRANLDANGRCHRATTCSIMPRQLHETTIKQYNHLLAISMNIAMRRYNAAHVTQ